MKSAHEILLEERVLRLRREEEVRKADRLIAEANSSIVVPAAIVVLWLVLMAVVALNSTFEDSKRFFPLGGMFLFITCGQLASTLFRRKRALRRLIRERCPEIDAALQHRKPNRPWSKRAADLRG